ARKLCQHSVYIRCRRRASSSDPPGRVASSSGYYDPFHVIKGQSTMCTQPRKKIPLGVTVALLGLLCAGCGPATAKVSGTVTYKTKPLTGGIVTFVTDHGSAEGTIDAQGAYTVEKAHIGATRVAVFSSGGGPIIKGAGGKDKMTVPPGLPPE